MKYLMTILAMGFTMMVRAQETAQEESVEMADEFFGEGKIYVVISVMAVLVLGLGIYLILQDRRISKMEKKVSQAVTAENQTR